VSPTATSSQQSANNAGQYAADLGCDNIAQQTPAGTTPKPKTMVRCSLDDQGYLVLAYESSTATTSAISSLRDQASGSGETLTIAAAPTWIVKAAEGPTIGTPMVKAAKAQGAKKLVLS
jgi:hypothetical protein